MIRQDSSAREGESALFTSLLIFVVAFALRFIAARFLAGEPVWDGHYYDFGAHRIAEGHGYSDDRVGSDGVTTHPWCHYPVGYSGYLAAFYWLLGPRAWVLHLANALAGALVAVVVFLLAREGLSDRRARLAGALTAVHPGLVLYGALAMSEILAALTVMTAFWVAVRGTRAWGGLRGAIAGALVLGVMFGDLTTVSMGFRRGWNHIYRNVKLADGSKVRDPTFAQQADNRAYTLGLSQILTRNMLLSLNYEVITDQGFLNNPYRKARYFDTNALGFSLENEIYPGTHTSNAASARVKYYLPYRAALEGSYRFYNDTWGILAHTVEVDYTQPWKRWIFDGHLRYYKQTQADFYSDIFSRANSANFLARDRELATFDNIAVGVGASYEFSQPRLRWLQWMQKSTVNARYDRMQIRYDNFRNATVTNPANGINAGAEPLYILNANVLELFVSIYF